MDNKNYVHSLPLLGGSSDDDFEIEETHMVTRKDERGRNLSMEQYWIIRFISRKNKVFKCVLTRSRKAFNVYRSYLQTLSLAALYYQMNGENILDYENWILLFFF
ncbi:hypothetical protein H312_00612 [Anncaliia algerae PRA339]|uniref:Uncharacterized protein n=1 Tax=Anncaliia algerae PRA339 TaxID=1288291 RepID=A0A059F4P3_9MICR|nr:hypothetical protein H312_00612 [Anncaliia algerae PRA339]